VDRDAGQRRHRHGLVPRFVNTDMIAKEGGGKSMNVPFVRNLEPRPRRCRSRPIDFRPARAGPQESRQFAWTSWWSGGDCAPGDRQGVVGASPTR
jgi:hypothetical protein